MHKPYFLTWTTYGTWLPGDERGSFVNDRREGAGPTAPKPNLVSHARSILRHEPFVLDGSGRGIVSDIIERHASLRAWPIRALNVRTNHVHVVLLIDRDAKRVMTEFKAWSTRALRETGIISDQQIAWTKGGSARHLNSDESVRRAIDYVLNAQD